MRGRRTFSREFKLTVVREVMQAEQPVGVICRKYQLAGPVLLRWRHEVETRGDEAFIPTVAAEGDAKDQRIAELERLCGQLALENQTLKKGLQAVAARNGTSSWSN
jgi:transposase